MARHARRAGRQPGTGRPARALRVVFGAALLLGLGGATPAGAQSAPDVVPIVACSFLDPGTGMHNTVWGYKNQTSGQKNDLVLPVGASNRFDNPGANAGQPTVFKPGTSQNAFIVTHRGSSTWTLTGRSATAPGSACRSNPVPVASASGWAPLVTLAAVTLLLGGVTFWRARRSARDRRA